MFSATATVLCLQAQHESVGLRGRICESSGVPLPVTACSCHQYSSNYRRGRIWGPAEPTGRCMPAPNLSPSGLDRREQRRHGHEARQHGCRLLCVSARVAHRVRRQALLKLSLDVLMRDPLEDPSMHFPMAHHRCHPRHETRTQMDGRENTPVTAAS
jgi:hypothetical protein